MRVGFDNDGCDFDDGLRIMTEGEIRLDGQFVVRVGLYRRQGDVNVYVREATVYVPTGPTARSMDAKKLRAAAERRLRDLDDLPIY